ncbi:Retrovirus-related Pol polyprotein from transposon TNT 1-94 [Sesamum angolense]|uniref:Retrovirus-related Pol polyprotein from transposon TNT 1-94 n=1 Tax=Sesamum angolense TaxID=2727404 RepID=A0AAE1T8T8_9LAMI|nr:Retrovirus-related Pol polyprotein from transposon TNT 1-94 [Sesamum angolense]
MGLRVHPQIDQYVGPIRGDDKEMEPAVMLGEASTSKKGKKARCWKKKRVKQKASPCELVVKGPTLAKGRGRMFLKLARQKMPATTAMRRSIGRGTVLNSLPLSKHNMIMAVQNNRKLDNQENSQIWHARLGLISQDRIRKLVDSKSLETDDLDNLSACESCLKGKMTKKPFVGQSRLASDLLDLIYSDVCGLFNTQARGGITYFITFTDDHSRRNQTMLDMVRSIMSFTELPLSFWGYAFETAAKLLNMAPSKTVTNTPYEI